MFAFSIPLDAQTASDDRLQLPILNRAPDHGTVRLRPEWPAVLAMTHLAQRASWLFGHQAAVLACAEQRPQPCLARRWSADPIQTRLDFHAWAYAVAHRRGQTANVEFFGKSGSAIAAVHLADCDPALDESIWRLMDDSPEPPHFERTIPMRPSAAFAIPLAIPLAEDALADALRSAVDAGIHLRVQLLNVGGSIRWTPTTQRLEHGPGYVELRSRYGRMQLRRRIGPTWLIQSSSADTGGPSIEAESVADGGRIRVTQTNAADRNLWRILCHQLAQE